MTDDEAVTTEGASPDQMKQLPKHRAEKVALDELADMDITEFGENPDTEVAG